MYVTEVVTPQQYKPLTEVNWYMLQNLRHLCTLYVLVDVSSGGSDDWAKGSLNIKYSFTVELPPSDEDAYGNGFVLPAYAIAGVVNETWPGIQAMAAA